MDPLSIAISAAGLASLLSGVVDKVGLFIDRQVHATERDEEFKGTISAFQTVLEQVSAIFEQRTKTQPFTRNSSEANHWDVIKNIISSCEKCVSRLDRSLPDTSSSRWLEEFRRQWRSERVDTLRAHVTSYYQCLSTSLLTLNVSNQWHMQESQDFLLENLSKLRHDIRGIRTANFGANDDVDPDADDNIRRWVIATSTIAEDIHQNAAENSLREIGVEQQLRPDKEELKILQNVLPDSTIGSSFASLLITEHLNEAERWMRERKFLRAAEEFQEVIRRREEHEGAAFEGRVRLEEQLAKALYKQNTEGALIEARNVLVEVLQRLRENSQDSSATIRLTDLLSRVYSQLGRFEPAKLTAWAALNVKISRHASNESIDRSKQLIASIYAQTGEPVDSQVLNPSLRGSGSVGPDIFSWLAVGGFASSKHRNSDASIGPQGSNIVNTPHPTKNYTPLQRAIEDGDREIVSVLLRRGAQVERRDSYGATALLLAATTKHAKIVKDLLTAGASADAVDDFGNTALHRVQSPDGGTLAAKQLLDQMPDGQSKRNMIDRTPLHFAASLGNYDMLNLLLETKPPPDVNAQDLGGDTPLHLAVESRRPKPIIERLCVAGANLEVKNKQGLTAVDMARQARPPITNIESFLQSTSSSVARRYS